MDITQSKLQKIEDALQRLRVQWKKALGQDRKVIGAQAQALKNAKEGILKKR